MLPSPILYAEVLKAVMPVKNIATIKIARLRALEKKKGFSDEDGAKSTHITARLDFSSSRRRCSAGVSEGVEGI